MQSTGDEPGRRFQEQAKAVLSLQHFCRYIRLLFRVPETVAVVALLYDDRLDPSTRDARKAHVGRAATAQALGCSFSQHEPARLAYGKFL